MNGISGLREIWALRGLDKIFCQNGTEGEICVATAKGGCPHAILAGSAFQDFDGLLHLLIWLRRLNLLGGVICGGGIFVFVRNRPVFLGVSDQNIWRYGGILNRFAGRGVVLGDGENES